jgi:hypothetical protein
MLVTILLVGKKGLEVTDFTCVSVDKDPLREDVGLRVAFTELHAEV